MKTLVFWGFVYGLVTVLGMNLIEVAQGAEVIRRAIVIDTSETNEASKQGYSVALENFVRSLEATGILHNQIVLLSDVHKKPTQNVWKAELRALVAAAKKEQESLDELQIYISACGVSNGVRDMLVPSGVPLEEIESTEDRRLISVEELEKEILETHATRIFLVINFKAFKTVTRSSGKQSSLNNIDIRRYRGLEYGEYFDDEEEMEEGTDAEAGAESGSETESGHRPGTENVAPQEHHVLRIVTRNQDMSGAQLDNFYQVMQTGLEGYADITGNNDGEVQVEELAYYLRDNSSTEVEIWRNGNVSFSLAKARRRLQIPDGLFQELGNTFTKQEFRQERDSAFSREQKKSATT
ncbi:MAG: hypothetical protein Q4C70_03075, partial [Planctomycetia bacterium]|nr:hypothetical protein [Planctomycetia bacterium]